MKLKTKLRAMLLHLCVALLISTCAYSQQLNWTQSIANADSLYANQQYLGAALAYDKLAYFETDAQLQLIYYIKKINGLKQVHLYADANRTINKINLSVYPDTLVAQLRYEAALCYYLDGQLEQAESQLIQLQLLNASTLIYRALPLYTLVLNELQRWAEAKQKLITYAKRLAKDTLQSNEYTNAIITNYATTPHLKRVRKAKVLSTLLPGAGQAYAGFGGEAAAAATLSLGALTLTAVGVYNQYYVTSFVVGYILFQRFYMANIARAEFLVNKKNYQRVKKHNTQLRKIVVQLAEASEVDKK